MDPFAVLGVKPGASPEEVTAAYRRMAKRWHPDLMGGLDAAKRMAQINAAYDVLRDEARRSERTATTVRERATRRPPPGAWLPPHVRRAMGAELLRVLQRGEDVRLVTTAATWASPRTVLAVTDRRLLWLLDDAVAHRVRWLKYSAITRASHRLSWPRRRKAVLRVHTDDGRRLSFAALAPQTAGFIVRHLSGAAARG